MPAGRVGLASTDTCLFSVVYCHVPVCLTDESAQAKGLLGASQVCGENCCQMSWKGAPLALIDVFSQKLGNFITTTKYYRTIKIGKKLYNTNLFHYVQNEIFINK